MTVFLGMSSFFIVVTVWYIHTLYVIEVLLILPVLPASFSGTLVLGFMLRVFSYSLEVIVLDCLFIKSYFTKSLSQIILIVKGSSPSSNSSSIISMMFWYYLGKFDSMQVIISELSNFMSIFCRSLLSNLSLVIHYSGFLVSSSIFRLVNFLLILVLKAPVIDSNLFEIFIRHCLASP